MSDHLPECPAADTTKQQYACYCAALRACEARVRAESFGDTGKALLDKGYAAGLSAARDAVAGLNPYHMRSLVNDEQFEAVVTSEALAAIDALRGES